MLRRLASLPPWKRRTIAMLAGLALGAGATAVYFYFTYAGLRELPAAYVAAHRAGDVERLAGLFCWDGVPDAERGRMKLVLKQELELTLKTARLDPLGPADGAPRETLSGRMTPNLKPVCRLTVTFGDAAGAGFTGWLVGKAPDGYRIAVYRPEPATGK